MKICFWMTSLFSLGGTKRVVTTLANELSKDHDITIMCHENRMKEDRSMYDLNDNIKVDFINIYEYIDDYQNDPATIHRRAIIKTNNLFGFYNTPNLCEKLGEAFFPTEATKRLASYINEKHYDVVIATARMALWLAKMSPYLNCKTIGWQHNCYDGYLHVKNKVFWKQECLLQKYLPQLGCYVVLSEYDQRDYLEKLNIPTTVMTNPRSFVSEQKSNCENKKFLVMTRFVYAKGLDLLLDAFEEFIKEDNKWEINLFGKGEVKNEIIQKAQRKGLSNRFHIYDYTNNPTKEYLDSSIYLLPSRWEGWPMVIMEAYEFGLPVIAFHTGSMDLIIRDGETGLLPQAFDTKAYADAMLKLAHDEKLRKRMSVNAIAESDKYDVGQIAKEWENLIESL